jgi:PAS domain S-box-containing protein
MSASTGEDLYGGKPMADIVRIFELAQRAAGVGVWWSDPERDGRLIWTDESCRIFGLRREDFDGKVETFFELVHSDDLERISEASRRALANEQAYDVRHRIVRPDGAVRWVHQAAEVIFGADGKPVQMIGMVEDITEQYEREAQLRDRNQELETVIKTLVGRENRMVELKEEVERLQRELAEKGKR